MLKSAYPPSYQNLKCGEIFCISPPAVFNITCTICDQKIKFDDFIIHFQSQHLTLVEDTINFNEFFIEKEEQVEDYRDYDDIGSNESEDDKYLEEIKSGPKKKFSKITRKSLARSVKKNKKVVDEFEISLDTDEKEFISIQENTLAENTISIDDEKLEKGVKENITVKEEDPRDDPIKQDFLGELKNIVGVDEEKDEQIEYDRDYDNVGNNLPQIKSQPKRKCSQNKIKGARKSLARNAKKTKKAKNDIDSDVVGEPEISLDTKGTKKDTKVNDNDDVVDEHEICLESNEKEFVSIQEIPLVNENEPVGGDVDSDEDEDYWPDETDLKETKTESDTDNKSKDELAFKCPLCPREYITKVALQKHHYSAHNPNKWDGKSPKPQNKCDICNQVFRTAPMLRTHKFKHTGIFCDICGKPFRQVGSMVRHKIRHTGIKEHKCEECPKEFFTAKELKSHMISHRGMQVVCEICGKRCRDGGDLTVHMRRHTGERPAKCNVCGKAFFTSHDLNVHAVAHTSERPFPCDICGSRFQRKKALRIHKRIHSKDRNHVCKICEKGFATSGGLNSHMRSHDTATIDKSNTTDLQTSVFIPTVFIGNPYLNIDTQEISGASMSSTTTEINVANADEVQLLATYIV